MRFRPTNIINQDCFMAGLYGRLSDEDRGKVDRFMESDSILNQRNYLHYTVNQINMAENAIPIKVFDEYYDDDYTGITFDRPNFQRMMKDMEAGKIDCILVKDFSRFGRDYVRIIEYLERDFERKNHQIRFVAYSDHYDSLFDKPDIGVRILLFLNEEYSRSQSHKVTTGMESMMRAGKFIGAFAPYGYRKDPKDKHHLLVDPLVCGYVKEIFSMNLTEGLGAAEIARHFNNRRIDPPTVYKEKLGLNYKCGNRIHTSAYWSADTIRRILQDETYTGTLVQHKTSTKDFKRKKIEAVSRENWIKVANMHEPIISIEEFNAVKRLHQAMPKNRNKTENANIFAGLLKCGDCMHALVRHAEKYKDKVYYSYHCRTHKRDFSLCYANRIYEKILTDIILNDINRVIAALSDLEKVVHNDRNYTLCNNGNKDIHLRMEKRKAELAKQQLLLTGAEEKWLLGKLSDARYEELLRKYKKEQEQMKQDIQLLEKSLEDNKDIFSDQWIKEFFKCGHVDKLTHEIMVEAVEGIYVYHDNKIVINYKFSEEIQQILEQ